MVLHEDGLTYLKLGAGIIKQLALTSKDSSDELNEWLSALSYGDNYILMLIRPSGVQHQKWVSRVISNADIPVGYELIGETQDVRDGGAENDS